MKYNESSIDSVTEEFDADSVPGFRKETKDDNFAPPAVASRARNRTVMLSPDITGQVRSMLQNPVSQNMGSLEAADPEVFQKPKEAMNNFESPKPAGKRQVEATKIHASPFTDRGQLSPLNPNSKSDKVEGTLELKYEHSRRATQDRKFEELGVGLMEQKDEVSRRPDAGRTKSFDLERNLSKRDPSGDHRQNLAPPVPQMSPRRNVVGKSKIIGFLVSYDENENGEFTEVRAGRWVISSNRSSSEDVIYFQDNSISAMHAILKVSKEGDVQILDQLSENGSGVLKIESGKEIDASDSGVKVQHGDLIRFGHRYFVFCAIPKIQIEN